MSKGVQIAVGATVVALLLGWYAASNMDGGATFTYFKTLDEFQANAAAFAGHHTRVHGYVTPGSIDRNVAAKQVRFRVQNDPPHAGGASTHTLTVLYSGLETPDMFKDGAEVVVEGVLSSADPHAVFDADRVLAKCPSKFKAAPPSQASL